jgi:hypothetical protein
MGNRGLGHHRGKCTPYLPVFERKTVNLIIYTFTLIKTEEEKTKANASRRKEIMKIKTEINT